MVNIKFTHSSFFFNICHLFHFSKPCLESLQLKDALNFSAIFPTRIVIVMQLISCLAASYDHMAWCDPATQHAAILAAMQPLDLLKLFLSS